MLTFAFGEGYREPCALVMGMFDGLHRGHRLLLDEAKKTGLPVVLTAMYGGKGGQLFTRGERAVIFARAGVAAVCEIRLDEELRAMSAEGFAGELFAKIEARAVYCGEDFRFGKDALGTPKTLKRCAFCPIFALPVVKNGGEKISSSALKERLLAGDMVALRAAGLNYFVQGTVEHGREVGRTYGFPTLNLTPSPEKLLPPDGVYGGLCETPKGKFPCIVNFGARPTFGVAERKIEAYLDGFSGNLYGETVRIFPTEFYRGIEKFESAEALKAQLMRDILRLRENGR